MTQGMAPLLTIELLESTFIKALDLPVMPEVGRQLIALKGQESVEIADMVHLIESDPVISAKIVAYASSPFFSYQGKLESVQEAVYHVLGMDMSMNIALAMAMGNQFRGPLKGPIGAMSIWRHSVYCAVLSQSIAAKITNQPDLKAGTAYLYGLLHNIGFLALGHIFSKELVTFNRTVESQNNIPINDLEKNILGVSHTKVGSLLMKSWDMPKEFGIIVENHHNSNYEGPHQVYSHISYIANALLKSIDIGDASDFSLPLHLLKKYDLSESQLKDMLDIVVQWQENLDHLASQLVA
jgi:HD-like signal output (HDOD) protein